MSPASRHIMLVSLCAVHFKLVALEVRCRVCSRHDCLQILSQAGKSRSGGGEVFNHKSMRYMHQ